MRTQILKGMLRPLITEVIREELKQSFVLKDGNETVFATPIYNVPESGSVFSFEVKGVKQRFFILSLETECFNTYTIVTAHGHLIR